MSKREAASFEETERRTTAYVLIGLALGFGGVLAALAYDWLAR
jgi:hypothetical protein